MDHVVWNYPEREDDKNVHFLFDSEFTLCGQAFEGYGSSGSTIHGIQGFKKVTKKVTCKGCKRIVDECKKVKPTEY